MNIRISALVASVALFMSAGSMAMAKGPIEKMDKNGDGVVTIDEFKGPDKRFEKIDDNKDGKLTDEEFKAANENRKNKGEKKNKGERKKKKKPANADEFFKSKDKNEDGKLDKTEMKSKNFDKIDKNKDGTLSKEEVEAMPKWMSPEEKKAAAGDRWFNNRDKNEDGSLNRDEFYGKNGDPFSRLDKNSDGKLSKEESQSRFDKKHARKQDKKNDPDHKKNSGAK